MSLQTSTVCQWGAALRVCVYVCNVEPLRQSGWKNPLNTQKLERHIKPIINILPGKNTKSIFFSEKLITWKGEGWV